MSTEQTPPTTAATAPTTAPAAPAATTPPAAPAEPNALATALTTGWEQFTKGELISYRLMAVILLVVAGVGTTIYITRSNLKVDSGRWTEFDSLSGSTAVPALEEFAKKNPNTAQAQFAELEVARILLGPEGTDRFSTPDAAKRKEAIENVVKARDSFAKLADTYKDDLLLKTICLQGAAKAEASLVGMLKEGSLDQYWGDPKKAVGYLDQVAEAAPDTDWGKDAKKLADVLRDQNSQKQVIELQRSVYLIPAPKVPAFDQKAPDNPFGGLGGLPGFPGSP